MTWDELKKFIQDVIDEKYFMKSLIMNNGYLLKQLRHYYLMGLDEYTHAYISNYARDKL